MQTDEREVISYETERNKLKEDIRVNIKSANTITIVMLIIALMIQFFASAIGDKSYWQIMIWIGAMIAPAICYISVLQMNLIVKKGYFGIVNDTLEKIERDHVNWFSRRDSLKDIFYFRKCGKYVTYERNTMPYASEGDGYYIVIFQMRKIKIMRLYNKKLYRMEEDSDS